MIIQKEENRGDYLATRLHPQQNRICMEKNSCCVFGGISWVWCITSETITGTLRLSRALKEKCPRYYSRHDITILLDDNACPHVAVPMNNYLKTLDWEVLPHPPYSPDIAPSYYHLFRSMAHTLSELRFTSYEDTKNWVDSWIASKDKEFFRFGIRTLPER
ncbi:Mariner Mos1 transposase [Eumeta japonica]|uniref:Mariner Mos1 transposase n=1 Tax=Eumeta variegata TaxID=151549 RepID=A0A4C1YMX2_EUMVA|nr:Mariner Mos1 transposase [Eumeta japonica]